MLQLFGLDHMKKIKMFKNNNGDIVIDKDYFSTIIYQLNDERIVGYCNDVLNRKIIIEPKSNNYYITKRFQNQSNIISWYDGDEFIKIKELFKNTIIQKEKTKTISDSLKEDRLDKSPISITDNESFKIEIGFRSEGDYLTISEDGINNRPWSFDEIDEINKVINYEYRKD